jgi:hypothetical protein
VRWEFQIDGFNLLVSMLIPKGRFGSGYGSLSLASFVADVEWEEELECQES